MRLPRTLPMMVTASLLVTILVVPSTVSAGPLDADEVVRLAVEASHLVVSADARLTARRSAVTAADAARMPEVAALAMVQQRNAVPELSVALGGAGSPPQTLFPSIETAYLAAVSVSQPLYTGGAIDSGRRSARHDLDAATADRLRTIADLSLTARTGYWRLVAAAAAVDAVKAQEIRTGRLLDDTTALRAAGMAVDADLRAAEARVATTRITVIRAETDRQRADAALRSLIGYGPATTLELAERRVIAVPSLPVQLKRLVETALGSRPELAAADGRLEAIAARQRLVEAGRRPSLALTGQWDLARPNSRYLPLADSWNDSWAVGLTARWTIFDGDRVRSKAAVIHAEQQAARAERAELVRLVTLETETARLELVAALEAVPAADTAATAAVAREAASSDRHAAGLAPIQEMLDAQAELAAAELEQIRSRAAAWIARAAVDRAIGR